MKQTSANSRMAGDEIPSDAVLFGSTPAMAEIHERLGKVADTNIPILLEGESGTGKEIIAKYIHQRSVWSEGPFVKVNCPAIPGTLVESELFGYEKGSFTGAAGTKPGRVEMADTGTLFLDEISELALELQSKLLQLLQDGQFCPIGARSDKKVEIRVVCATNRRLEREASSGRFRQDLYYRITGVIFQLPPLRERVADIPMLVSYFAGLHSERYQRKVPPLSASTMSLLKTHAWPGNIRELENLTKRYVVLGTEDAIVSALHSRTAEQYEAEIPLDSSLPLKKVTREAVRNLESKIILNALQANHWNRKRAARVLKISYRALLYKLKQTGLDTHRDNSIEVPSAD
ncbi:MAG: sigma-54 dependent transcriptional regulator [Terriglobales bacterium]|jgi:two-component system response regulator AtoC